MEWIGFKPPPMWQKFSTVQGCCTEWIIIGYTALQLSITLFFKHICVCL